MTAPTAEELADQVYQAILEADRERPRTKQSDNFVVGISELGFCSERTRRMLAGITPEPTDRLEAFIGTALGDYIEQAVMAKYPEAIRQAEVVTTLKGDQGTFNLTGHPDLVFPAWGVVDVKTVRGLETVRRTGPSRQQQFQRHGYALGAWEAGLFGDLDLNQVMVANVWFDRSGEEPKPYAQMERFSHEVMFEAAQWLDEVVYAYINGVEARKEPHRAVCEGWCGHYLDCRAGDTDVEGLLTDPRHLAAVEMYREGLSLEQDGRRLKNQAKGNLRGINGSTGTYGVRWVHVNETVIPERHQHGYEKLSISRLK